MPVPDLILGQNNCAMKTRTYELFAPLEFDSALASAGRGGAPAASLRRMASYTSRRWTGTSLGASTPSRTLSPRISTTTIVMSLLMTILSFFLRERTSMVASFMVPRRHTVRPKRLLQRERSLLTPIRRGFHPAAGVPRRRQVASAQAL